MKSLLSRSMAFALALGLALPVSALAQGKKGGKKNQPAARTTGSKKADDKSKTADTAAQAQKKKEQSSFGKRKFDSKAAPKLDDLKKEALLDKKRDESIEQLKKIIPKFEDGNPQKADLLFQLSELYWEKSQFLARKEEKSYEDVYATYQLALDKGEKGLKEPKRDTRESELFRSETMRLYETILRDYPAYERKDEVLFALAYNQYELGKKDAAVKRYEELIKNYPNSKFIGDAHVQLGNHWFENNNLVKAEENFKRAYANPNPQISSYALYKLGWCDFNAGKIEEGLKKMQQVVSFAEAKKGYTDLKNEALKDMVLFYVQLDRPDDGINYFKAKAPKKRQNRLIASMADGLASAGHHDSAIKAYRFLLNDAPMGPVAPEYQQAIVASYEGLRQRDNVKAEIKKLVDLYSPGSQWWKANEANQNVIRNAFSLTEEKMRTMVTEYHSEAQKTKSVATFKLARDIYKQYVDSFASSPDENFVSDQAFNLRFYYADILWALEEWENAAAQYDIVVKFKLPNRDEAKQAANETYRKIAGRSSVLAYKKLTDIEAGRLGKTELKDSETVDDKKKKEAVKKSVVIKRTGLTADQMKEKPLTKFEEKLIASCDLYNGMFPGNEDEIDIRYLAAVTYFDKSHFVPAAQRFGEIIGKWPEDKNSATAADLSMSVLEDKQEWLELNKLARAFMANKKLMAGKGGADFTRRVGTVVEGSQYKWVDEVVYKKEKNPSKAAEEFLKFVAEFPRSDNADRAMTYAMIIFQEANQIDRGVDAGERVLREYPGSVFELKTRYTLAVFYEKIADFQKSAEMYESFVDLYDQKKDPKKYAEEQKKKAAEAKKLAAAAAKADKNKKAADKKAEAKKDDKKVAGKASPSDRKVNPEELKAQIADADKWIADAVFNAALWWEGLGKSDKAMAAYELYMKRFKDKKDVPQIAFNQALILEKDGKTAEALKAWETYNTTWAKDARATASSHYVAKYKQYQIHLKAKADKESSKLEEELIKTYGKLKPEEQKEFANLNAYGHARFNATEPMWKQYTDIKFAKVATIKKDFASKQKKIQEVEKTYLDILNIGAGEWGIAALTRIGMAYSDFATNIMKSPDPKGLDEDQVDMYRSELETLALPLEEKSIEALDKALAKAYELNIYNEWTLLGQNKINEYKRGYYAEQKSVSYQGSEFFATESLLKVAGVVAQQDVKPTAPKAEDNKPTTTEEKSAEKKPEPTAVRTQP